MAEIPQARYDLFVSKRMLTRLTTNLSAPELESIYGNRIRSQMKEMFNQVAFWNKNKGGMVKKWTPSVKCFDN